MKHQKGTGSSGLGTASRDEANGVTTIVRTGNRVLDRALASDRSTRPDLRTMQAGCRSAVARPAVLADAPAAGAGVLTDTMSLTLDRDGSGTTLHAGATHQIVDGSGRARTIRVWHELATHGNN
ncbi:MAG: hypothetical protein AAGC46_07510 [Solirubrobacteraceae bacterium]|nr:hypothetical protein [Patulibacter sp.]